MKASTICGSDIRAIYREHLGKGPEAYQNVICGHEPAGQIVATARACAGSTRVTASCCTHQRLRSLS